MCEDQLVIRDSYFKALDIKKWMPSQNFQMTKKETKILCDIVKFSVSSL